MAQPPASSTAPNALFLSPEAPIAGAGGGGLRSVSLLRYLETRYAVEVLRFDLAPHSRSIAAKVLRNAVRMIRRRPPLIDRYSGYEEQLERKIAGRSYEIGIVEHMWCAPYAPLLRKYCGRLVLDLHNVESALYATHARAAPWPESWSHAWFAQCFRRWEREWAPKFDTVLTASADDASRIDHPDVHVYPNALPRIEHPRGTESNAIVFSGNMEYHPNVEAVRWFRTEVWPLFRRDDIEWRLVGRNPEAVRKWTTGDPRIKVTGAVEDAVAELASAKVCVVPLLSGSGTRFKILEAWAAGRAVVSTSIGAEGLGAVSGEHLLIADSPQEFAAAIEQVLSDADLRHRLGDSGRRLYEEKFTWDAAWAALRAAGI